MEEQVNDYRKTILIVDDEKMIINLLTHHLIREGYNVLTAKDGPEAIDIATSKKPDLILLDVMLPKLDGLTVCKRIKNEMNVPILMVTAKDEELDKIVGLELGADDYITKPFEIVEMLARVESVLRRYRKAENLIVEEDVTIDLASMEVKKNGKQVMLTLKEFNLLVLLVRNKNVALYREVIYENVWGSDYMGDSRTVDLHIQRVRKKLGWEKKIESVYKVGYRLKG